LTRSQSGLFALFCVDTSVGGLCMILALL